ncbi:MAG: hypothetical protein COC09_02945 [Gammaproteobacteria bacterium]|nr:MAG: hypothetical protein COC09_09665 [Gammaproteobacteria bacterium]PCH64401.1 MAG: hypothetical protein COC09_02945 [Gammaproteobacteria bacterium]
MQTAKQDVQDMLNRLPEGSSYEDIQYHLYVLEKIRRGESRAEEEGTISQSEAKARLSQWITK